VLVTRQKKRRREVLDAVIKERKGVAARKKKKKGKGESIPIGSDYKEREKKKENLRFNHRGKRGKAGRRNFLEGGKGPIPPPKERENVLSFLSMKGREGGVTYGVRGRRSFSSFGKEGKVQNKGRKRHIPLSSRGGGGLSEKRGGGVEKS